MIASLYVHIPFCRKKCSYCDFVSYAGKEELIDEYVEALVKEAAALTQIIENEKLFLNNPLPKGEGLGVKTIYFGGGTPTLLEPRHFDKIISSIICHLSLDIGHSEISVEANPGTADKAKLKALRSLGINRLSIGVQSFNDKHLRTLGRIHTSSEAIRFYEDARAAGFDNINLDLIFALPGQTLTEWQADLCIALALQPNHLSTYNLQVEEHTPLWQICRTPTPSSQFLVPSEEEELAMYEYTIETLTTAGYKHYEISNFAKPGRECLHNINYWKNSNYLGLGAGAHSHVNGERWANPDNIEEYLGCGWATGMVNSRKLKEPKTQPYDHSSRSTLQQETIFMGLRLLDGLSVEKFAGFEKEVTELISDGLLERKNGHYKLTPRGLYLGNLVFEKFV